jgi:hypothetical protein
LELGWTTRHRSWAKTFPYYETDSSHGKGDHRRVILAYGHQRRKLPMQRVRMGVYHCNDAEPDKQSVDPSTLEESPGELSVQQFLVFVLVT